MKKPLLILLLFSLCFAQYYDIALVRVNDSAVVPALAYDDNSTSYKDNSIENPDVEVRICADSPSNLLNRYVSLCYADASDGDFLELTHFPVHITSVPPSGCVYVPLELSAFKAWYPSIPYVFIGTSADPSSASRWKLTRLSGWFSGNYSINTTQNGNLVNITVTNAADDGGNSIVPDVDYLVIGLVRADFTAMDTAISSINDTVTLVADSPSATYSIFINGIGPDIPPYVQIISPANGAEYSASSVPFTYIMTDDDSIVNCWYVLDGVTTQMPSCGPAYILSGLRDGLHTLALYANDTTGNIGSDSVQFRVRTAEKPPEGGGGTGIPYYQPIVPPPPPFMQFTIIPEDIFITINYANDGEAGFTIASTIPLNDLYCYVRGDFENYTRVELDSNTIGANQTISGTIVVSMPATDILDYADGKEGVLQCVGNATSTLLASTLANVYLIINKPSMELQENASIVIYQGEMLNYTLEVINKNNMTELQNLTVEFQKYRALFTDKSITQKMAPGESGELRLIVKAPSDLTPGQYLVPINFYEHGRLVGSAMITLEVLESPAPPPVICIVPDLMWTVIILLIGLIASVLVFYWQKRKEKEEIVMFEKESMKEAAGEPASVRDALGAWIEQNKRPLLYAVLTMIVFVAAWLIILFSLARCA